MSRPELGRWKKRKTYAKRKIKSEDIVLMTELKQQGFSFKEIGKKFDVCATTVRYHLLSPDNRKTKIMQHTEDYYERKKHRLKIRLEENASITHIDYNTDKKKIYK
jgi:DNA invertase Pin-like site-specific DNA recombinase